MSGSLLPVSQQWFDNNGNPLAAGRIETYIAGTSTPKSTWSDYALTSLNTNPVVLDAAGRASIFGDNSAYKLVVKNAAGATIYTQDNIVLREALPVPSVGTSGYFLSNNGSDYIWSPFDSAWFNSIIGSRPYRLITEFADVRADDPTFDNGPGFQAALNSVSGTGVVLLVPPGTFYFGSGITLNVDNSLIGYDARISILQATGAFDLITLNRSQLSSRRAFGNFRLTGSSSSNPASRAIVLGPSGSGVYTFDVFNINFTSDTWYDGVVGTGENDSTLLERLYCLGGVFGRAFIDVQLAANGIAPSAGFTIRFAHAGHQTNIGFGKNYVGIRLQGSDCARIEGCIINGFDYNFDFWSQVSGGRTSYSSSMSHCHSEDFRPFVMDFQSWAPSTSYGVGTRRVPNPANGFVYRATVAGTSGGAAPTWPTTIGATVVDGTVTWECQAYNSRRWAATTSYPAGYLVKATKANANSWIFQSSGGTSGTTEPAWGGLTTIDYGTTFVDGTITWTAVHTSVAVRQFGEPGNHKVAVRDTLIGNNLVQYDQQSGDMLIENCDNFTANNGAAASDISFRYTGTTADGNVVITNSGIRGNFKPFVTAPTDSFVSTVQLQNARISNDTLGFVDTSGNGMFNYFLPTNNSPEGGTRTTSGTVTLDPKSDYSIALNGASTVTVADTNAMHSGKRYIIQSLTSAGVTISLASGSFNFNGQTLSSITLPSNGGFIELLSKRTGYEIIASSQYLPARMRQAETSGTNGGGFTSGSWQPRLFNEEIDPSAFVTTSGSTWTSWTLPPGIYTVRATAPAFNVGNHQLRIQNTTAGTTLASSAIASTGAGVQSSVVAERTFTLSVSSNIELQHRCATTNATDGFGVAGSFGTEVFAQVTIEKHI